jgi:hypothetical protein
MRTCLPRASEVRTRFGIGSLECPIRFVRGGSQLTYLRESNRSDLRAHPSGQEELSSDSTPSVPRCSKVNSFSAACGTRCGHANERTFTQVGPLCRLSYVRRRSGKALFALFRGLAHRTTRRPKIFRVWRKQSAKTSRKKDSPQTWFPPSQKIKFNSVFAVLTRFGKPLRSADADPACG